MVSKEYVDKEISTVIEQLTESRSELRQRIQLLENEGVTSQDMTDQFVTEIGGLRSTIMANITEIVEKHQKKADSSIEEISDTVEGFEKDLSKVLDRATKSIKTLEEALKDRITRKYVDEQIAVLKEMVESLANAGIETTETVQSIYDRLHTAESTAVIETLMKTLIDNFSRASVDFGGVSGALEDKASYQYVDGNDRTIRRSVRGLEHRHNVFLEHLDDQQSQIDEIKRNYKSLSTEAELRFDNITNINMDTEATLDEMWSFLSRLVFILKATIAPQYGQGILTKETFDVANELHGIAKKHVKNSKPTLKSAQKMLESSSDSLLSLEEIEARKHLSEHPSKD